MNQVEATLTSLFASADTSLRLLNCPLAAQPVNNLTERFKVEATRLALAVRLQAAAQQWRPKSDAYSRYDIFKEVKLLNQLLERGDNDIQPWAPLADWIETFANEAASKRFPDKVAMFSFVRQLADVLDVIANGIVNDVRTNLEAICRDMGMVNYKDAFEKRFKDACEKQFKVAFEKQFKDPCEQEFKDACEKQFKDTCEEQFKDDCEKKFKDAVQKRFNDAFEKQIKEFKEQVMLDCADHGCLHLKDYISDADKKAWFSKLSKSWKMDGAQT
jgi:hypothetical protein